MLVDTYNHYASGHMGRVAGIVLHAGGNHAPGSGRPLTGHKTIPAPSARTLAELVAADEKASGDKQTFWTAFFHLTPKLMQYYDGLMQVATVRPFSHLG